MGRPRAGARVHRGERRERAERAQTLFVVARHAGLRKPRGAEEELGSLPARAYHRLGRRRVPRRDLCSKVDCERENKEKRRRKKNYHNF